MDDDGTLRMQQPSSLHWILLVVDLAKDPLVESCKQKDEFRGTGDSNLGNPFLLEPTGHCRFTVESDSGIGYYVALL
jgi:hypothetical protein